MRKLAERTQKSLTEIEISVSTIVQSINDVSDKMNENAQGMQRLTTISQDVEQKVNDTSLEMQHSIEVAVKSVEDSKTMVKHTDEIINQIAEINAHSSSNKELYYAFLATKEATFILSPLKLVSIFSS